MDDKPSKLHYLIWLIGSRIKDLWLTIRHFVRNSTPQFFLQIADFFSHNSYALTQWLSSSKDRAKAAQEERRQQMERLSLGARSGFAKFIDFTFSVAKAPFQFINWLWKLLQIMRRMSFRAACKEAWGGYREFVERLFDYSILLLFRFLDMRWWLRTLLLIAIITGITGIILGPWAFRSAKEWRSQHLYEQAQQLKDDERMIDAYNKSRAAALLDLDNPEVLDFTIELAEEIYNPEALWWAERKAKVEGQTEESLLKVIEISALVGSPQVGLKYLSILQENFPNSHSITDSRLRILMAMGKQLEAFQLAEQALAEGDDSETMHRILVLYNIGSLEPDRQERLIEHLQEHLYRNDDVGLTIQEQILAVADNLSPNIIQSIDFAQLLEVIQENEDAEPEYIALAIGCALKNNAITREQAIRDILDFYDMEKPAEQEKALEVAINFGLYELLDELSAEQIDNTGHYVERLVLGKEPDLQAAQAILDQAEENGLTLLQRNLWQAMLAGEREDFYQYANYLRLALEQTLNSRDAIEIRRIVMMNGTHRQKMEYLNSIFRFYPNDPKVIADCLNYTYYNGSSDELENFAQQISLEALKNYPTRQLFLAYVKSLYKKDLPACRSYLEALVMRHPQDSIYYIVLAFAYQQSNQPELARSLLESFPLGTDYEKIPPYIRLCLTVCGFLNAAPNPDSLPQEREKELLREATGDFAEET
ncbi:hypothetical protein [Cerasicoccus frondis]|uniref:hypothetical protein n=1 Tax=Cerasicoccus frondis TaxID=490090 RepID=UPI0028529355|nr:hypothetical protein [Cerasicoccus frondis]